MNESSVKYQIIDYAKILFGSLLVALSVNIFLKPNSLVSGGLTGLGIVVESVSKRYLGFAIPVAYTNFGLNVPLIIIGYLLKGKRFVARTIIAIIGLTVLLQLTKNIPHINVDLILCAIFGGVLSGLGVVFVTSGYATNGGTVLAASLLNIVFKNVKYANILFVLDGTIIILGLLVFGIQTTLYSLISSFCINRTINALSHHKGGEKHISIISENYKDIFNKILENINPSTLYVQAGSDHKKEDQSIIYCTVPGKKVKDLKKLVKSVDNNSTIIMNSIEKI